MSFALPYTDEHHAFRATVRRFVEREVAPHHGEWEERGQVPRALWRKAGELGFLCPAIPAEYGGGGGDFLLSTIVTEELCWAGATGPLFYLHSDIVAPYLLHYGSEAQKRKWLPRMTSGETITGICMTEPGAGSDVAAIRTRARRDGDELVVSGQKIFISNGQIADLFIVAAKTDPEAGAKGVSLVLVESDRPGFARGRNLEKVGMHAQDTSELFFDEVRVPASNLLGAEGKGFGYLMTQLPQERLLVAIGAVAAAESAIRWTLDYVRDRQAFGAPLAERQHVRFALTEAHTEVTIGRVFLDHCIALHLEGKLDTATASMAKYWLSDMQNQVIDACLQLHGGYGYMREYPIARAWADARVQRIYGGANEIMKEIIARKLFEGR
ncbi:MAG TPA: acyl-CoA dehydrogenase family protein [Burkholderiales bacterium]|nr:acyl-CoA dehydrogenase family protein [Burkholderiales bacterium]